MFLDLCALKQFNLYDRSFEFRSNSWQYCLMVMVDVEKNCCQWLFTLFTNSSLLSKEEITLIDVYLNCLRCFAEWVSTSNRGVTARNTRALLLTILGFWRTVEEISRRKEIFKGNLLMTNYHIDEFTDYL